MESQDTRVIAVVLDETEWREFLEIERHPVEWLRGQIRQRLTRRHGKDTWSPDPAGADILNEPVGSTSLDYARLSEVEGAR